MESIVIWITGLSGAGKTTVGRKVYQQIKDKYLHTVFLDGDVFREILGNDLGHDPKDRLQNALRLSRMCKFLSDEKFIVVCATMSLYPEVWAWNRAHIANYYEVYLKADIETLIKRDSKGVYGKPRQEGGGNVVGVDLPFHEPSSPHLTIENNRENPQDLEKIITEIVSSIQKKYPS